MSGASLRDRLSSTTKYFIAGVAVAIAAAVRTLLDPWIHNSAHYLLFIVAVLAAGMLGGACAAAFATALAIATSIFLYGPDVLTADPTEIITFIAACIGIIWVSHRLEQMRRRAIETEARLERRANAAGIVAEELNLLIDGALGYAIYMLDPGGNVAIWNKGAERLKGWNESEVLGRHISLFYSPDAIAAGTPEEDLERAKRLGKFEEEHCQIRKDGSRFLAHVAITALYDDDGKLRGFGKVVRDVTEQRAAERALNVKTAHLHSIVSTMPDAMVVIDEDGTILSFNAAAERLFGFTESEIVGSNVSRLMPKPDRARHDGYLERYLRTEESHIIGISRTVRGMRRDGTSFPMELSVGEANGDGQRVFTGFARDLTDKQAAEERIEELRSDLVHVARISAMGTMASTIAHELNQPITAVVNYVQAISHLLERPAPADLPMIREALVDAASEALRAGDIVRRLRHFVARGDVEKSVEDLASMIHEAARLGLIGARENGIDIHFDLDESAPPVLVDRVQIQQVLINLMRNATEAISAAPVRQVRVSTQYAIAGLVRVTIADSGPGIPENIAADLFAPFNSSKPDGLGLGLSICRTIVEANGGRIWAERHGGGGAIFHFTLITAEDDRP